MNCNDIIINIIICLATGVITGFITGTLVTQHYNKVDDKRNQAIFMMDLANKCIKVVSLALEPVRFIGNSERLNQLHDLVFRISYYERKELLKGKEKEFYDLYKKVSQEIRDIVRVYMSYNIPSNIVLDDETKKKLKDETAIEEQNFILKLENMKTELVQLMNLADIIVNKYS